MLKKYADNESEDKFREEYEQGLVEYITNAYGDNYYDVTTFALDLTDGDGDINVQHDTFETSIVLGDGDNHVDIDHA